VATAVDIALSSSAGRWFPSLSISDDPARDDAAGPDRRVDPLEQAADRLEVGKMLDGGEREDQVRGRLEYEVVEVSVPCV
jgi:hypothetical protein